MTLSFGDGWDEPVQFDDWPLQGTPHFATSRAYDIFLRELRRYTLEEVGGRSFLIAGHRGAGKTALVVQAVETLRNERIQLSVSADLNSVSRRGRLQRPLLVKLAAHSLIAAPPKLRKPEADKPADGKDKDAKDGKPAPAPSPAPAAAPAPPEDPPDPVAGALVHLSIALYRALAQEVAQGFAFHAASAPGSSRADLRELAAQLLLDLDDAPEPALLRRKWEQLGRLADGVLWPRSAAATLDAARIEDQGLREIIAVSTAAQAFQVVSGNVTYKTTSSDAATRDDESKASLDIKDLVARLGAVFAGTAAGSVAVAANQGAPLALGLGLIVWLGSSAALSRTISHKLHRVRTRDYTFLRDRSVQTLDRELPQVIERVRDAGLAPVFVVDELDKLDNVDATITALIGRLKHIVSDYGFFCFLTGRGYYDGLDRLTANVAYPKEHTYFSDRLLIAARPSDLFRYVTQLLVSDTSGPDENLPRATFALMTIHRSKLNFTDLVRELNRHARSDRGLTLTTQELRERADIRLEAAIQLAGDQALRDPAIANRFTEDEGFAQLAVDALHYVPRLWEEDFNQEIDCSDKTLKDVLIARMAGKCKADPPAADPVAPAADASFTISASDWLLLRRLVDRQLGYLADFKSLSLALHDRPRPDSWRLDEIVPIELEQSLIAPVAGKPGQYRFLFDTTASAIAEPVIPPDPVDVQVATYLALFDAFDALLTFVGLTLDDLVAAGYMPATLTGETLADARKLFTGPDRSPDIMDGAIRTAQLLRNALAARGNLLSNVLVAFEKYRGYAAPERPAGAILLALARYFPATASGSDLVPKGLGELLSGALANILMNLALTTPTGLDALRNALAAQRPGHQAAIVQPGEAELLGWWERWRGRLFAWIDTGRTEIGELDDGDIVTAAQGLPPGILFRSDLAAMTPRDWSAVVVAGLPDAQGTFAVPGWVLFVGLYALGFDARSLDAVARTYGTRFPDRAPLDMVPIAAITAKAKTSAPSGLLLVEQGASASGLDPDYGDQPVITMALADFNRYKEGIGWLAAAGVIAGLIDESE